MMDLLILTGTFMAGCYVGMLLMAVLQMAREHAPVVPPIIHTYAELSAVTGIPIARLERLRVFAPEAEPPVVQGSTVALECHTQDLPLWQPRMQPEYFPEPEPNGACLALSPDGQHRCTNPHGHGGAHRVQDQYGMLGWFDPPIVASVCTPQTQASAAVADAAQWGQPKREDA